MRLILKHGKSFTTYICPECGQIEKITEDEDEFCTNCGSRMKVCEKQDNNPDVPKAPEPEPQPAAQKKRGRKPKPKEGTCGTCASAMVALNGYTCKIDCKGHDSDDACSLYIKGDPID